MSKGLVIGVDYGTDSVRSVLIDGSNGAELTSKVYYYEEWAAGKYCSPSENQFRQHPNDYIKGLEYFYQRNFKDQLGKERSAEIKGIAIDTTGSTPVAVNEKWDSFSFIARVLNRIPNAMFVLWKDHTAIKEAEEINQHAEKYSPNYLKYVGGDLLF